ncbi:hypothetical protein [Xanthomonas sacchari]|uniref:Lipase n=1 Tax=Xanthomonas sacchari TaxID=56458 RepID=A0A2P5Z141_9XANT|nr:hypothetical protein [Xanthomonas sacchari]MDV0439595.1 hypothetical protein [Xanthomonas sacchari]PPU81115.1 hypothetical protein XsacCFBP4641_16200 [Xanthomonas sacchari]
MKLADQQYAALAYDVYSKPRQTGVNSPEVDIGGVSYRRLEYVDRPSGYQGVLYQRVDDGQLIVAHRGTEFDRQPLQDGVLADGGMVATRHNAQVADALDFTREALAYANTLGKGREAPEVSVTGHSLGGALAQASAHHFGLKGETFNAYGAVSLDRRIPEGGADVINHVMAGDPVSAASRHYGQVRIYATPEEVATLQRAGYDNSKGSWEARNPFSAVGGLIVESHRMHNFLPVDGNGRPDRSVLEDPAAHQRAAQDAPMIGRYREDVESMRIGTTLLARGVRGLAGDAVNELRGPLPPGEDRQGISAPEWSEHMQRLHLPKKDAHAPQGWHVPLKVPEQGAAVRDEDPLFCAIKARFPAATPDATLRHAAAQAQRDGMTRPEQIKHVMVDGCSAWIEGDTPGFRVKVDLSVAPSRPEEVIASPAKGGAALALPQADSDAQQVSARTR